jgi:flagellar assembly factor FliW
MNTAARPLDQATGGSSMQLVTLPNGVPGLSPDVDWQLEGLGDTDESAFMLLSCTTASEVGMIVTIPWLFFPDYAPDVPEVEYEELDLESPEDAIVFCSVTLDAENDLIFVNLLGPFIVNSKSGVGRQVVLTDSEYPVRAPVQLAV